MVYASVTILLIILVLTVWKFVKGNAKFSAFNDRDDRAGSMAITLAFAVSASKGQVNDIEVEIIKNWASENLPDTIGDRKFHGALTATRAFFHAGNKVDAGGICEELLSTTNPSQRYSIIELCMKIVAADGIATAKELVYLRKLSELLELDTVKVSMLMEKLVPVNIHQVKDAEFILGINNMMSPEDTRDKLNREYRKWNGRITNSDSNIRTQAKLMIELITQLKNQQFCIK